MPPKTQDEIDNLRDTLRKDVNDLHSKTNSISTQISNIDSKLEATLPFLATTTDVEKNMGNHVKEFHSPKSGSGRSFPPQELKGIDSKLIAALIGATTLLISGLSALIQKFLTTGF